MRLCRAEIFGGHFDLYNSLDVRLPSPIVRGFGRSPQAVNTPTLVKHSFELELRNKRFGLRFRLRLRRHHGHVRDRGKTHSGFPKTVRSCQGESQRLGKESGSNCQTAQLYWVTGRRRAMESVRSKHHKRQLYRTHHVLAACCGCSGGRD